MAAAAWAGRRSSRRPTCCVSHDLKVGGDKRMRFEMNVLNLFNQKTATAHLRPGQSSAAPVGGNRSEPRRDLSKGYDYNALLAASPDGAAKIGDDPRYGWAICSTPGCRRASASDSSSEAESGPRSGRGPDSRVNGFQRFKGSNSSKVPRVPKVLHAPPHRRTSWPHPPSAPSFRTFRPHSPCAPSVRTFWSPPSHPHPRTSHL